MKLPGYYSSGQFAALANVTVRTIRYYDKHNILKPSHVNGNGARFYTDQDLARLQQILLLKYLGFSLDEIKEITIGETDSGILRTSLELQKKLLQDRIEQMELVRTAIDDTVHMLDTRQEIDWSQMLNLIRLTGMENTLASQYKNASNLSARINLHTMYAQNPETWFSWLYRQCDLKHHFHVLEIGCGDGSLWIENIDQVPQHLQVILSDVSPGMLRDARRQLESAHKGFSFNCFDCRNIPYPEDSFDLVIANHLLFYLEDPSVVFEQVRRVLKPGGQLICSTYGTRHMVEITNLVQAFDKRIVLSGECLYEKFGLDNGKQLLSPYFRKIERRDYEDSLLVTQPEPLISYILSCHGNQNQYLPDHYREFRQFVQSHTDKGFSISKEAGIFICTE